MKTKALSYQKKMLNPLIFRLGMFYKLPSVFFWGVGLKALDEEKCQVTIPFSWRSQNPFSSIYFAALAGAAELSTGALCQLHLADRTPHSMLVVDFKMKYSKKANSKITFSCNQGIELQNTLDELKVAGSATTITMISVGHNMSGETVCTAEITWSFKRK